MEVGCPHPDLLLKYLTKAQVVEWMAYATLEPVGNPVKIEDPEKERKNTRAALEGMFRRMKEKQDSGK